MTYAVLSISAAKRLAKAYTKAQLALTAIGLQLAAAGISTLAESAKAKAKKPRKAKATKPSKPAAPKAPAKQADPLTT